MDWGQYIIMKLEALQWIYGLVAVFGGIARYLNGYVNGERFKFSILVASAFVAGFSGYMFAALGESLAMPQQMLFVMAGVGGFFGEQTMKFILEYTQKRVE